MESPVAASSSRASGGPHHRGRVVGTRSPDREVPFGYTEGVERGCEDV